MKHLSFLLFSSFLFISFFFSPKNIWASHILFEDDFSVSNNLWSEVDPWGSWNVNGDQNYEGEVTLFGHPELPSYSIAGNSAWQNYSYRLRVKGVLGADKVILFRVTPSNNAYLLNLRSSYSLGSTNVPSSVLLGKRNVLGTNSASLLTYMNYPIQNNVWYSVKIDLLNNNIKVYIDENIVIDFTDPSPIIGGAIGLEMWPGGYSLPTTNLQTINYFDDIIVVDPSIPEHTSGPFELPFAYEGRGTNNQDAFIDAFWARRTALFDHDPAKESFINFLGNTYLPIDCETNIDACYDSHNGVDFDDIPEASDKALSVANGEVVYVSDRTPNDKNCIPEKSGYGCVVIAKYPTDDFADIYALFAHLKDIYVETGDLVNEDTELGLMGKTGNVSGPHLHFSTMTQLENFGISSIQKMNKGNWKELIINVANNSNQDFSKGKKSYCTYKVDLFTFAFNDPSGWSSEETDPYSNSVEDGGCGYQNNLLWKYDTSIN